MSRPRVNNPSLGDRFGRLVITELELRLPPSPSQVARGHCGARAARVVCDCGVEKTLALNSLYNGSTVSCGCLKAEHGAERLRSIARTHGLTTDPTTATLHGLWVNIRRRCTDPTHAKWEYYGGRGITLYPEWIEDPVAFVHYVLDTIGPRLNDLQIDRIDNERGYEPNNLRWATHSEQSLNRRPSSQWKNAKVGA